MRQDAIHSEHERNEALSLNRRGPGWPKSNASAGRPRGTRANARAIEQQPLKLTDQQPLLITPEGLDQFERNPLKFRSPTSRLAYLIGHDPRDKAGLAKISARISDWMMNRKDIAVSPDGPAPLFVFGPGLQGQDERVTRALSSVVKGLVKGDSPDRSSSTSARTRTRKRTRAISFRDILEDGGVAFRLKLDDHETDLDEAPVSGEELQTGNNDDKLNERTIVQLLDKFTKAHKLTADDVLTAARQLADAKELALPASPPELYRDRPKDENIIGFLRRAWSPWIEQGLLTRPHLLHADPPAYAALAQWLRKNEIPADLKLPTKSEVVTSQLENIGDLKEARRLVTAAYRRNF